MQNDPVLFVSFWLDFELGLGLGLDASKKEEWKAVHSRISGQIRPVSDLDSEAFGIAYKRSKATPETGEEVRCL